MSLTASDIEKAAGSLARVARRTELVYNERLSKLPRG